MKLNNYNINLNPKEPSGQQIEKHMDFDALLGQFADNPPPKAPSKVRWLYYAGGAVAACLIGFMVYTTVISPSGPEMTTTEYLATLPYINPPIPAVQPTFASEKLSATKGGVYEYENGSRLIVPPAAFIDAKGQTVQGDVSIRYREFHDFVDFFLSGIPMEYDSAGIKYQLESAGMVEIYAEQNGQRLNVAPGKKIDVELVSEIVVPAANRGRVPAYNIYRLDTERRNWVYDGVDDISLLEEEDLAESTDNEASIQRKLDGELARIQRIEAKELAAIEATIPKPVAPVRPQRADASAPVFNFSFSEDQIVYSEDVTQEERANIDQAQAALTDLRRQYENTIWQIAASNADFNRQAAAGIDWDDMKLRQLNERDYELTLINGNNEMKVTVNPVLMGEDYDNAMAKFNATFKEYERQLAEREEQLADQKQVLEERLAKERAIAELEFDQQIKALRENGQDVAATDAVIRQKVLNRFRVSNLGVWNCDRPLPPFMVRVKGEFIDDESNEYAHHTAYLVNKDFNTVSRLYTGKGTNVVYSNTADNILWLVTKENKLAVFRPEEFKRINKDKDDYTFVLNVVDKAIETEDDVRRILQF
ncbi:MAG: hypothetical protein AAGG75_11345 [Bacteroidota bacterium]